MNDCDWVSPTPASLPNHNDIASINLISKGPRFSSPDANGKIIRSRTLLHMSHPNAEHPPNPDSDQDPGTQRPSR